MAVLVIAHSEGGLLDSGVYTCVTAALEISKEVDILCTKKVNNGKDCTNDGIIDMVEFEDLVGSREETFDKYFFAIVDFGKTIGIDHSYDENTPDKDRFITKELYLAAQKASNERVDIYPGVKELKYFSKPHTFEEMQLLTEASNFDDLNNIYKDAKNEDTTL